MQYSIPKSWYKPMFFDTEEEALAYREEHKLSTPVHFSDKRQKHYLDGHNRLADIIDESIRDAEIELKLKSEIGFEWSSGLSWSDTH